MFPYCFNIPHHVNCVFIQPKFFLFGEKGGEEKLYYAYLKNLTVLCLIDHSISEIDCYCFKHISILLSVIRKVLVLFIFLAEWLPWSHIQLSCLFIYLYFKAKNSLWSYDREITCHNTTGKGSALGFLKGLHFYWPLHHLLTKVWWFWLGWS